MPQACFPNTGGNLQPRLSPKAHEFLQLGLSSKIPMGIFSFLSSCHHSSQHSEQAVVPQHNRAPSSLGTAHPQPPSLAGDSPELH